MTHMHYSIGSIADLISGKKTANKPKVVERKIDLEAISSPNKLNFKRKISQEDNGTGQSADLHDAFKEKTKKRKKLSLTATHSVDSNENISTVENNYFLKKAEPAENAERRTSNAEKRIKAKESKRKVMEKEKHDMCKERTVFVGNVAIGTSKAELRKRFATYGRIETIRFRSVPVPDAKTPKKLAAIKQQFHVSRTSLHSYIKFASAQDSVKALAENGRVYDSHHMRVSHCKDGVEATRDESKAIFVGNVSFECEEEELWTTFADCGAIESVRVVRDRRTGIGKGFAYVNFISADAVQMALPMDNNITVRNRPLRVSICKLKQKSKKKKHSQTSKITPSTKKSNDEKDSSKPTSNFHGLKFTDIKKKKTIDKGVKQKKKIAKILTAKPTPNLKKLE